MTDPEALAELRQMIVPEAYLRSEDQEKARRLRDGFYAPYPCSYEKVELGIPVIASLPTDQCFKMTEARHWKGVWRNEFEGSKFCPGATHECNYEPNRDDIWLTIREGLPQHDLQGRGGLYKVDFIGRRTLYRSPQGHFGMSDYEIIVDRPISMKELEPPPPPLTKAQEEALEKECEAAPNCLTPRELQELTSGKK